LNVEEFRAHRWRHVQALGAKAERLALAFGKDGPLLVASAWLHDISYAPELQRSGFHHLDGAQAVERLKGEARLAALIANHSGGALEAPLRGLEREMRAYPDEGGPIRDALWTCDMTTSPSGEPLDFEERLRDIVDRYGPDHPVPRSILAVAEQIREAIDRTRDRAAAAGVSVDL
jgi:hypothetical protein